MPCKREMMLSLIILGFLFATLASGCAYESSDDDKSSDDQTSDNDDSGDDTSYKGPPPDFSKPTFIFVLRPHRNNETDYPWPEHRDDSLLDGSYFSRIVVTAMEGEETEIFSQLMEEGVGEYYVSRDIPFQTLQEEPYYRGFQQLLIELLDAEESPVASLDLPMYWSDSTSCDDGQYGQVIQLIPVTIDFGPDLEAQIWNNTGMMQSFNMFSAQFDDEVPEDRVREIADIMGIDPMDLYTFDGTGGLAFLDGRPTDEELAEISRRFMRYLEVWAMDYSCNSQDVDDAM